MKKFIYLFVAVFGLFACSESEDIDIVYPEGSGNEELPLELAVDSVQVFKQMLSGHAEASRLGLQFQFSDIEPTGVYVKPNANLQIEVSLLAGSDYPQLLVGTYSHGDDWNTQPQTYDLHEGMNQIAVNEEGGMLYIRYTADNQPKGEVKVNFKDGWEHSPLYRYKKTSNANWKRMLAKFSDLPTATLVGEKEFLVVSLEKAMEYQDENQDELLKAIDDILKIQGDLSGMDGSEKIHEPIAHKLLLVEYSGSDYYMFAYTHRTAYRKSDAIHYVLDPWAIKNEGWGPWHEIGHMHQMAAWTWSEIVESTVNLYSLAVEKEFGITPSRYNRDNRWEEVRNYLALPDDQRIFNSNQADVWVRLGMFYQLQLAFGKHFLKELHKHIRKTQPVIYSKEDKMRTFMLAACQVSGKDLSGFFQKWGMNFSNSEAVYEEIANLWLLEPDSDISLLTD
ncbi:M60 family metallopeptidase [Marinifilum caeruleilacunae]|nr:M60 family metallopeptidase [Marinifilum caeruleilacunae]